MGGVDGDREEEGRTQSRRGSRKAEFFKRAKATNETSARRATLKEIEENVVEANEVSKLNSIHSVEGCQRGVTEIDGGFECKRQRRTGWHDASRRRV